MLSRWLILVLVSVGDVLLESEAFTISTRPVRGSVTDARSNGIISDVTGSSTALYAEAKKKKKKKKKAAVASASSPEEAPVVKKKKTKKKKKAKAPVAADENLVMMQSEQVQEVPPTPKARDPPPSPPNPPAEPEQQEEEEDETAPTITTVETETTTITTKMDKPSSYSEDGVYLGPQVRVPDILDFDVTGGRPQKVIETEEQLARKKEMFAEIESGVRSYPKIFDDYGVLEEEEFAEYDTDDPDAIDANTLGSYDITNLQAKFEYEYDPETDPDPNLITDTEGYLQETEKDEEGIEVGYDPMYGPSNPVDTRTKLGAAESYMIDAKTRNEDMQTPEFYPGDLEIEFNEDVVKLRKSMEVIESYTDEFLPGMIIPRHVAKWHGYNEPMSYPAKNYTNNRFTKPGDLTNFDELSPFRARQRAVELARSRNAEWMPDGVSQEYHKEQRKPYEDAGTLVGTLRKGECDPEIVELIQPVLKILGSCVELLSIEQGTVFRFHYHGLMKNKYGMSCWTETMIRDCGVEVTGVVFETGFRRRDPAYDGGDPYYGFIQEPQV